MTEKRFIINMENECIDDAKEEIFIDFNDRIDFYKLCEFLNKLVDKNEQLQKDCTALINHNQEYRKENEQLKTTISRLIEQNRKNNDLLVSDIRLLEKALWCPNCARNIKRLKELKKEFEND